MRAGCLGDKPDECVSDCLRDERPACETRQRGLVDCYAAATDRDFECDDGSWKSRPRAGVCQLEQDDVFACKEPVLAECLSSCATRVMRAQAAFDADGRDASTSWACADVAADCECACYTLYFLSVGPEAGFFGCLEATAGELCAVAAGAAEPEFAGESCKPPGIFWACIDQATAR